MKSASAIAFDYRPSRWLIAAIGLVALLAVAAVVASGLPAWSKWPLTVAVAVYAAYELRQLLRDPVRRVSWHEAGHWRIANTDGTEHVAELVHGSVRGTWIVLQLRYTDRRRVSIVLAPDNCDADVHRRLRVRLARTRET